MSLAKFTIGKLYANFTTLIDHKNQENQSTVGE